MPRVLEHADQVLDHADRAAWWLRRHVRVVAPIAVVLVAIVVIVAVSGGGGSDRKLPANAAALVGDMPVTTADVDHWQKVYSRAAGSQQAPSPTQARQVAFTMLVQGAWVTQEAARQNVTVPDAKVNQTADAYLAQLGGTGANQAQILGQLGLSPADLRYQMRLSLLTTALQSKVAKSVKAPSADAIQAAYNANPNRWAHTSKRDVRMLVAGTKANAAAAVAALNAGKDFTTVAKQYTTDASLAQSGGAVKGLAPGTTTSDVENPIFAAPLQVLEGPVKTSAGWMVFKVQRIVPTGDQTLAQATPKIRRDLTGSAQAQAVAKYVDDVQSRWKSRTLCRDTLASLPVCPKA